MTLQTLLVSDLSVLFDEDDFGRTVGYYPVSGSAALVDGIVMQKKENQDPRRRGMTVMSCELAVRRSEVETPAYRDRFQFDGNYWRLDVDRGDKGVLHKDTSLFVLALERVL